MGSIREEDMDDDEIEVKEYFESQKPKKFIIRVNSSARIRFDLFVMLFATWNCFAIPYEIAFEPEISSHWAWITFNACILLTFLLRDT